MTEPQTPPTQEPQQSQHSEEEIAAAIALVLADDASVLPAGVTPLAAISALLGLLPGAPEDSVRDAAARLIVEDTRPDIGETGTLRRAHMINLVYSAHYVINAMRRLGTKVSEGESLHKALVNEGRYLQQHRQANEARVAGARINAAAVERWGPILGWHHTNKASTHRPSHVKADGANYRPDSPPRSTEGMLPGMALHCDCVPGPPKPNARILD